MSRFLLIFFQFFLLSEISAETWPSIDLLQKETFRVLKTRQITINNDPVYKQKKRYLAYSLSPLIEKLAEQFNSSLTESVLIFTAADGYQVTMPYQDALLENGYIAFKDLVAKENNWVKFKFGSNIITPAPYYLIWPKKSIDKWRYPFPFQLTSISLQPVEIYFAAAAPLSKEETLTKGFNLFSRYCIRCHSINNTGGQVGPALTGQKSISQFFSNQQLSGFILNAPALRPDTKMPAFNLILNKSDSLNIIDYLRSIHSESQTKKH